MKLLRQEEFSEADYDSVFDHTHYHSLILSYHKEGLVQGKSSMDCNWIQQVDSDQHQ